MTGRSSCGNWLCRWILFGIVLISGIGLVKATLAQVTPTVPRDGAMPSQEWREPFNCGPNSLYVFLKARGYQVDYDDLLRSIPFREVGCSLQDLSDEATHRGLSTRVIRLDPRELVRQELPLIVHLESNRSVAGHFEVLLAANDRAVTLLEPSTALVRDVDLATFQMQWTSYALVEAKSHSYELLAGVILVILGVTLNLAYSSLASRSRSSSQQPSETLPQS